MCYLYGRLYLHVHFTDVVENAWHELPIVSQPTKLHIQYLQLSYIHLSIAFASLCTVSNDCGFYVPRVLTVALWEISCVQ